MRDYFRRLLPWVGIGVVCGLLLIILDVKLPDSLRLFILMVVPASLLSTTFHELGHAIAATAVGFRLLAFGVWPVTAYRRNDVWRFRWFENHSLAGFVTPDPVTSNDLRRRLFYMIAGGPAASLLLGVIAAVLYWNAQAAPDWFVVLCGTTALLSLLSTIDVVIPFRVRHAISDGSRLRVLIKGKKDAERFCCLAMLTGAMLGPLRPREWSAEMIEIVSATDDPSPDGLVALTMRYNWLFDLCRYEEAYAVLSKIVNRDLPPQHKGVWQLEAAWFEVRFHGDPAAARAIVEKVQPVSSDSFRCAKAKVEACIALAEQRWDVAAKSAAEALRLAEKAGKTGLDDALREELHKLAADIEEKRKSTLLVE